jgi:hypothetical protein
MDLRVDGEIFYWRGPSPYHFVAVPDEQSAALKAASAAVTYGWGMIPVTATIEGTEWTTSLFPKDGRYLVPLKDKVRYGLELDVGDVVSIELHVDV